MIEDLGALSEHMDVEAELAVVGAGPAGIVVALEAAQHGISVVVLESGDRTFDPSVQELSEAAEWDHHRHAALSLSMRRQVGGTSNIWGGRCVPFDPVDFASRPYLGVPAWPVGYEEIQGYFQRACDWMVCGRAVFDKTQVPNLPDATVPGFVDGGVLGSSLERWSLPTNFGRVYRERLEHAQRVRLLTHITCTEIICPAEGGSARHLKCRTNAGGHVQVKAKAFVVACGGLESTRLLMSSTGPAGEQLGNKGGHLGRWYMAHVEGSIANVRFSTAPRQTVFDYEQDIDGVYIRRRFSFSAEYQREHHLPNVVSWLGNWELPDARHGYGQLSFIYLALTSPLGPRLAPEVQRLSMTGSEIPGTPYGLATITSKSSHFRNILRHPFATGRFAAGFGTRRFLTRGRRVPGFFMYSKDNLYPLQYHGEQLPNAASKVTLTREKDRLGRRKLAVDLQFTPQDNNGIIQAHEHWDRYFRKLDIGRLEYQYDDLEQAINQRMGGGFHQTGTTRMSASAADGVVDQNLAVHGVPNVYVASSSAFVTSGQANSTFMIVAFAVRLADHLAQTLKTPALDHIYEPEVPISLSKGA
jgi:GMC oxidoreductase/FAD dependent oxidoreductase